MPKEAPKTFGSMHRTLPYPSASSSAPAARHSVTASPTCQPSIPSISCDRHASASWPPEKDEMLLKARQQGLNWQPIANQFFPDKSANACRKRHERLMEKRNNIDEWDIAKMERLAKAYNDVREQMWRLLADQMGGERWQVVEARCMEKGLKTLQTAGRTASRRERIAQHLQSSPDIEENGYLVHSHRYERSKSQPSSEIDETFNDSAIGPDPAEQPFSTMHNLSSPPAAARITTSATHTPRPHHSHPHAAPRTHTPPLHPPIRTFSNTSLSSLSSAAGFTPLSTMAPQLPSELISARHSPTQQTLPSFSAAFGMPLMPSAIRAPVTCSSF